MNVVFYSTLNVTYVCLQYGADAGGDIYIYRVATDFRRYLGFETFKIDDTTSKIGQLMSMNWLHDKQEQVWFYSIIPDGGWDHVGT